MSMPPKPFAKMGAGSFAVELIAVIFTHPLKALLPIYFRDVGKLTIIRFLQSENV